MIWYIENVDLQSESTLLLGILLFLVIIFRINPSWELESSKNTFLLRAYIHASSSRLRAGCILATSENFGKLYFLCTANRLEVAARR